MTDVVLESARAIILFGIVVYLWRSGRYKFTHFRSGWNYILAGFGLLLFATVLDITDNFESLNRFVIIGDTSTEAFLEKFVGYLGGFIVLAIGLFKWIPEVQGLSDLVDERTQDIEKTNAILTTEIEERKRAETAKDEFLATMSHELRTPLTSIKGALGLMETMNKNTHSEDQNDLLSISVRNTDSMLLLVNELLDYGKLISGEMVIKTAPHNIAELVSKSVEDSQGYAIAQSVTLKYTEPLTPMNGNINPHRFGQVLRNVLSNAVKFSDPGSIVEIATETRDGHVVVSVRDEGLGISEGNQEKIFEPFVQIDSSRTRKYPGTGLGLSISKSLTESMDGDIFFDSVLGNGSTFYLRFPEVK